MRFSVKYLVVLLLAAAVAGAYYMGLFEGVSLESLKVRQDSLRAQASAHPLAFSLAYFFGYIVMAALSLPGAAVLTLAGGAVFGFSRGLVLVSFASSIGASLAFLLGRYLLREWVEEKFGQKFLQVREGFERDGAGYLAFLRLAPIFPFFLVNILSGLTNLPLGKFYLVSQLAMLPGTAVFVNAGTELSKIDSLSGILSPRLLLAFCLLGIFPIAAKKGAEYWRKRDVA